MEHVIRRPRADDADQIGEVHVRSWQAAYRGMVPDEYLDAMDPEVRAAAWRETIEATTGLADLVVVALDGTVSGFASFGTCRDPDVDERTGEVWAIYLAPEAWDRGLGRALMSAAIAGLDSLGFDDAVLWVLDANERARRFYEAGGWVPDGATKLDDSRGFALHEVRYRRQLR